MNCRTRWGAPTRAIPLLCTLLLLFSVVRAPGQMYYVQSIPGFHIEGINNVGQAVGQVGKAAYLFQGVGLPLVPLDTMGYPTTRAFGISDNGLIVGMAAGLGDPSVPLLWTSGVPADISSWSADHFWFTGINASGDAAGFWDGHGVCLYRGGAWVPFDPIPGSQVDYLRINNAGQVCGSATNSGGVFGFFNDGGSTVLLPGSGTSPFTMNDAGIVVGSISGPFGQHAFYYQGGVLNDIGAFKNLRTTAIGINNQNRIVGQALSANGARTFHFVYDPAVGQMADLDKAIIPGHGLGTLWLLGINDRGEILGNDQSNQAFVMTSVQIASFTLAPNPIMGGRTAQATITLNAPAPPTGVTFTLVGKPKVTLPPATVTIPAGALSATFPVGTLPGAAKTEAYVRVRNGLYPVEAPLTVYSPKPVPIELTVEPDHNFGCFYVRVGTVRLDTPPGPEGLDVKISATGRGSRHLDFNPVVHFYFGETVKQFNIWTGDFFGDYEVTVRATANGKFATQVVYLYGEV